MAGFRMSASAGSSGEESGRAALARVGLAGSFFECFAGSRSGRFAMTPIWVESGDEESAAASLELDPGALDHFAPFGRIRSDQRGEFLGRAARGLVADRGEVVLEGRRLDRPVDRRVEL